jgi:GNAT superfamily N-acetyltransferase
VDLIRRTEAAGMRATEDHWALIPPDAARRLGARVARVGDGLLTLAARSDSARMNRVMGLGNRGQAKESTIDEVIDLYRAAGRESFSVLVSPGPQSRRIIGWLLARGFARRGGYSLLVRDCRVPVPRAGVGIRVLRAKRAQAPVVVGIHQRCFGLPAIRRSWSIASARSSAYEHYLAYVGETAAGVGSLRVEGTLAWFGAAATLSRWRRRGVHAALIAARLRSAARHGCRWAWVETLAPAAGRPGSSRRNLLRLGFQEICIRPIFVRKGRGPRRARSTRSAPTA